MPLKGGNYPPSLVTGVPGYMEPCYFHFVGFQFGEIKHIVGKMQDMFGRPLHVFEKIVLSLFQ